jgi:hypothetical protein
MVCFHPENIRVEEQACGRAGRQGQPGNAMICVCMERYFEQHGRSSFENLQNNNIDDDETLRAWLEQERTKRVHQLSKYRTHASELEKRLFAILLIFVQATEKLRCFEILNVEVFHRRNYFSFSQQKKKNTVVQRALTKIERDWGNF